MLKGKCVSNWELGMAYESRVYEAKKETQAFYCLLWIIHQGECIRIVMKFYVSHSIVNNTMNRSQYADMQRAEQVLLCLGLNLKNN